MENKIDSAVSVTNGDKKVTKIKNSTVNITKCGQKEDKTKIKINKDGTVTLNSIYVEELEVLAKKITKALADQGEDVSEWRKFGIIMETLEQWK